MMTWENPWSNSQSAFDRLRTLPNFLLWSVVGFISGWVQTRRIPYLIQGTPALLLSFPILSLTLHSKNELNTESITRYITTARDHLKNQRPDQAEFYLNRLKSVSVQSDQLLLTRAEFAMMKDSPDIAESAYHKMLSNTDQSLDALAHRELALLEIKRTRNANTMHASDAISHLKEALRRNPADLATHELLTKLYLQRGDLKSVAQHLEPVAKSNPAMNFELARIYEQLDRPVKRNESATAAIIYLKSEMEKLKATGAISLQSDTIKTQWVDTSLQLSEALSMLGKHSEAAEELTHAIDGYDSEKLRTQLARTYLLQAADVADTDKSWQKRWELVTLSRNYAPDSPEALTLLANVTVFAPDELKTQAIRELQPYLDNDKAPPPVYYIVGTAAASTKQWDIAEKFLRRSVALEPRADISWNNLAYVLSSRTSPDWDEAEKSIDTAIHLNPLPAAYHETRGQIMAGRQRWTEVIRELELALTAMPPNLTIHQTLAIAYSQLGDDDLAEYHRARRIALESR